MGEIEHKPSESNIKRADETIAIEHYCKAKVKKCIVRPFSSHLIVDWAMFESCIKREIKFNLLRNK